MTTRTEIRDALIRLINRHAHHDGEPIHSPSAIAGEDNVIGVETDGDDLFFIEVHDT